MMAFGTGRNHIAQAVLVAGANALKYSWASPKEVTP